MIVIEETLGLMQALAARPMTPKDSQRPNFIGVDYECGCGSLHPVKSTHYLGCGGLNEFFFLCPNGWCTLVKITGIFRIKAQSFWTCEFKLFEKMNDELGI